MERQRALQRIERSLVSWVLLALLVTAVVEDAHAFQRRSWLAVTGMLSDYRMSDVNQGIEDLGIALLGGVFVDPVPVGLGFGFGIGLDLTRHMAVGIDYDRYTARTSGEGTNSDLQTGRVEIAITLPANTISGSVEFRHHGGEGVDIDDEGRWSLGAGVSGGVIWTDSELKVTSDTRGIEITTFSGTGPLLQGFLAADIWQSPRLGFGSTVGYRYAKIDSPDIRLNGVTNTATLASIDYSGVYLELAIKFALQ